MLHTVSVFSEEHSLYNRMSARVIENVWVNGKVSFSSMLFNGSGNSCYKESVTINPSKFQVSVFSYFSITKIKLPKFGRNSTLCSWSSRILVVQNIWSHLVPVRIDQRQALFILQNYEKGQLSQIEFLKTKNLRLCWSHCWQCRRLLHH